MAVTKTFKLKKLRGKGVVRVDGQILLWREKRKKLGLAKPTPKVKTPLDAQECPRIEIRVETSTPVAMEAEKDLWERFKP